MTITKKIIMILIKTLSLTMKDSRAVQGQLSKYEKQSKMKIFFLIPTKENLGMKEKEKKKEKI